MSEISTSLYIPEKIKVGFQERSDTYTKMLGYVIYYDHKGVLRKEKSWNSWRSNDIDPVEFENTPTSGFVLNKKTGDYRGDWGNGRHAHVRVYDPRNFEIEISVNNLLYILANTDCFKGKGLDGDFVYAWEGTELVLVPCSTGDYKSIKEHSDLQKKKVSAKDLVFGAEYKTKSGETYIYLGRHGHYEQQWHTSRHTRTLKRSHIFFCDAYRDWSTRNPYIPLNSMSSIGERIGDHISPNAFELLSGFQSSYEANKVKSIFLAPDDGDYIARVEDGSQMWVYTEETDVEGKKRFSRYCNNTEQKYDYESRRYLKFLTGTQEREYEIWFSESTGSIDFNGVSSYDNYYSTDTWRTHNTQLSINPKFLDTFKFINPSETKFVKKENIGRLGYASDYYTMRLSNYPYVEDNGLMLYVKMEDGSVFPYGENGPIKRKS